MIVDLILNARFHRPDLLTCQVVPIVSPLLMIADPLFSPVPLV